MIDMIGNKRLPCVTVCPRFHFCEPGDLFEAGHSAIEISEKQVVLVISSQYSEIFRRDSCG
jgi:hypothetical protein